jgi:hypothetical protein
VCLTMSYLLLWNNFKIFSVYCLSLCYYHFGVYFLFKPTQVILLLLFFKGKMTSKVQPGSLVPPKPNGTRFPSLMYPTDPKVELCARVDTYYDLTTAAVFLVYIVFGVLYTFLGK